MAEIRLKIKIMCVFKLFMGDNEERDVGYGS